MPYTGPREKAANSSGRSEMSSLTKDGIRAGMGNSMNISKKATADSMAVTVTLWGAAPPSRTGGGDCVDIGFRHKKTLLFLFENTPDTLTSPR